MQVDTPALATIPGQEQHGVGGCTRPGGLGQPRGEGPCRPGGIKRKEPEGPAPPPGWEAGRALENQTRRRGDQPAEYQEN